jgi:magnesium transporter
MDDEPGRGPAISVLRQGASGWERTRLDDPADLSARPREATWVVVAGLADLPRVAREIDLDTTSLALLDHRVDRLRDAAAHSSAFAHVDRSPAGHVLLSTPTIWYDEATRDVSTGSLTVVLDDHLVLTSETGDANILGQAAERLLSGVPTPDAGTHEVLAALLLTLLSEAGEVELGLGEAVADAERLVFSSDHEDPVERIYDLKREIAEARRALNPVLTALPELQAQSDDDRAARRASAWLTRVQAGTDRLDRHLEDQDHLLGDMLSAHLAQVGVRQNEDMRKISAWAAMIAVPTLIAGVYGMNFRHMPELTWLVGYPAAIVLMVVSCVVLYRAFRRSGWL